MLHEADLSEHGAEGVGITAIEHFIPISADEEKTNDYENCFYICRFCNESRSNTPVVDKLGRRLLDPCTCIWAEHFVAVDNRILPVDGDRDAEYTTAVYDLNDPRKVDYRKARRERLEEWLELLFKGPQLVEALLEQDRAQDSVDHSRMILQAAQRLRRSILRAEKDLPRYTAIPPDADRTCRCGRNDHHVLPPGLDVQILDI